MPSRQATGKAVNIAILNHVAYGSMVRLKMSAHASNNATTMPAGRPPILEATQVAIADVAPHASTTTPNTQCG